MIVGSAFVRLLLDAPDEAAGKRGKCPFCGQSFEVIVDTSIPFQRFTTDCEVCCRPIEVVAECEPGEILSLSAQAG